MSFISGIMQYWFFSECLISLRRICSRFIHVAYVRIMFIYLSMDGHLGCFYPLGIVNNAVINMDRQISVKSLLSFLLGIFLLDHTVIPRLSSFRKCHPGFHIRPTIWHSTSDAQGLQFLFILMSMYFWLLFVYVFFVSS